MLYYKECLYCGEPFTTPNIRRLYDRPECRRKRDNEREQERRAAETELRSEYCMPDSWAQNDLGEEITSNSLNDGWTEDCYLCADEVLGGPLACQQCQYAKMKKNDLVCWGCEHGINVSRSRSPS